METHDSLSLYEPTPARAVTILSVPTELGSDARGLKEAPAYLYDRGLRAMLKHIGADISDEVVVECPPPHLATGTLKNLEGIRGVAEQTSTVVAKSLKRADAVLVLGGDHSAAIGSLRAASTVYRRLGVIYIDAHPDVNTGETTLTGNIHGMVAALALGHGEDLLANPRPVIPEHFLHIGIKDIDPCEAEFLRSEGTHYHTMFDIVRRGLGPVFDSIDALAKKVDTVWVSMDMDSIDKQFAPGVAMQNTGGLNEREILSLAQYIGHAFPIAGMDLVEMVPAKDYAGKTAALALGITARLLGGEHGGYSDYIAEYESSRAILEL